MLSTLMFHIVLVEPEIPPNTGNIARLCLAADATLHLVRPLGFSIDDKTLKRAGLDYWKQTRVELWDNFAQLQAAHPQERFWYLTTKYPRPYYEAPLKAGDFLVFGRETKGLPEPLLAANAGRCLTIPMAPQARSLNLATSVGIVLFEGLRQIRTAPGAPQA
ncbi:MAG: tRNA (cytidine(34)-2'-O)-methyltransferase [Verrucomicrobiota bacterium]